MSKLSEFMLNHFVPDLGTLGDVPAYATKKPQRPSMSVSLRWRGTVAARRRVGTVTSTDSSISVACARQRDPPLRASRASVSALRACPRFYQPDHASLRVGAKLDGAVRGHEGV